jgi:hypothetical protein
LEKTEDYYDEWQDLIEDVDQKQKKLKENTEDYNN